jgi:hypothetical protein
VQPRKDDAGSASERDLPDQKTSVRLPVPSTWAVKGCTLYTYDGLRRSIDLPPTPVPNASRDSRLLLLTVSFLKGVDCSDNFTGPLPTFLRALPVNASTLRACVA